MPFSPCLRSPGLVLACAIASAASAQPSPKPGPPPSLKPSLKPAGLVTIKNFDYAPMTTTIAAGGSVTWKNLDGEPHTVVSVDGRFRSPALDEGESFTFRFAKPGAYRYVCSIHPRMHAVVVVR